MNVLAASLGICGECENVVTMTGIPMDAMNAKWVCSKCGKELGQTDFGFKEVTPGKFERNKWVNKDGKWSDHVTSGFQIGKFFVINSLPARPY